MRNILAFVFSLGLIVSSSVVMAQNFALTCNALDPRTETPMREFYPGDSILLTLSGNIPAELTERKAIRVDVSAQAQISGFKIPYTLSRFNLSLPNRQVDGNGVTPEPIIDGRFYEEELVDIPFGFPGGSYRVLIRVAVGDQIRKCRLQVDVL
ncbi:MAG: hypothetical protein K9L32_00165 [Chromatiaceae bacterium]|nr:hypothetical protein [Chromatiaceae bacterium]